MLKKIAAYFLPILLLSLMGVESTAATACFTPSALKGCVPFTITVDASCAVYDPTIATPQYNYDFINNPGASNFTTSTTKTFTTPGTYRILQLIDGSATGRTFIDILVTASPDPIFTVKSCAGRNVSLTMADPSDPSAVYDNYDINWGDGSPLQNVAPASTTTHVFTSDGFTSITVIGKFLPNAACGSKTVTPYAIQTLTKPDLTEIAVVTQRTSGGSIQIKFNAVQGQNYTIQRSTNGGTFSTIQTLLTSTVGSTSYMDNNLNTQANVYQYRIVAFDDCGLTLPSDPIYSIIIKAAADNAFNSITWNGDPTVNNFTLTKNTTVQSLASPTSISYTDNTVVCGSKYCYNTTAALATLTVAGIPQKSISIDTCITAVSITTPSTPQNVNSTVNGSNVSISWTPVGSNGTYKIYESRNSGAYNQIKQQTSSSYSYPIPNLTSSYCYQLEYSDLCGNTSPRSMTTCPVILEGNLSGTTITLNWNTYTGYSPTGVQSYAVQKIDQNGNVLSETNVGLLTTFSETVSLSDPYVNYRIKVLPTDGTFSNSFSNNSLFEFEPDLFIPDIFTPNGDNTNDYFIVKGRYINTYSISIFSRWGEVVYASTDMTLGWNGSNNFVYAPEGAYTYKIIATDVNNKEFTKTGTITLTR